MEVDEDLARRLGLKYRVIGSGCLIAAVDAEAFLSGCQEEGLRVLGIEGFRVEGDTRTPDMQAIADFSSAGGPYAVADSVRDARRFLRCAGSPHLMFEFVVEVTKAQR